MKRLIGFMGLLWLGLSLSACAGDHIRWTEEVKLSDGNVVQVQRHVELTTSGFPVQSRGFNKYYEICYPPMDIHWKSRGGYVPDIFDIVEGKAYMHVPISSCIQCMLHGYPETDALYFVWNNETWKRISHEEFPALSEWNLLMGVKAAPGHEKDDPSGLITLKDKEKRSSSLRREQKRLGWKRVNESYAYRANGIGQCNACRSSKATTDESPDIFVNDDKNACQP
mgnify:CR=1 FL=1